MSSNNNNNSNSNKKKKKRVFVTVGTTKFDKLVRTVTSNEFVDMLKTKGYTSMCIQAGHGETDLSQMRFGDDFEFSFFSLKASGLKQDIESADLIITHAGAGSIFECLKLMKNTVAVVNEDLADNHQMELAGELAQQGHLLCATCSNLLSIVQNAKLDNFKPLPEPSTHEFAALLRQQQQQQQYSDATLASASVSASASSRPNSSAVPSSSSSSSLLLLPPLLITASAVAASLLIRHLLMQ